MENNIKSTFRDFLATAIKNHELDDNDDFFKMGFVNSLFAMQLVNFVEKEFNFKVENDDLQLTNFNTIQALTNLVLRKQAA